jgi:hypothetical protein
MEAERPDQREGIPSMVSHRHWQSSLGVFIPSRAANLYNAESMDSFDRSTCMRLRGWLAFNHMYILSKCILFGLIKRVGCGKREGQPRTVEFGLLVGV